MTERWVEFTREDGKKVLANMPRVRLIVRQRFNGDGPLKGKEFTFLYGENGFELAIEKPEHFLPPTPKPDRRGLKVVPK